MSQRPGFMSVSFSDSGLTTMGHERKMIREDDVKFEGQDGILELTDVRVVWYKKPERKESLKKFAAIAGAVAGAALLEGMGSRDRGIGGQVMRSAGRGLAAAAVFGAISSWSQDSFVNKDARGNAESIALPIIAISQAQAMGNKLVLPLKSGGDMRFEFKQPKLITAFVANISAARDQGKCPYCGSPSRGLAMCPQCGAPLEGGGGAGAVSSGPAPGTTFTVPTQPGGQGGYCTNCGQPLPAGAKFCSRCGQRV